MDMSTAEYFRNINSQEGLFLWLTMLISFFLGFLIAYLLRSAKVRRLKKELREQEEQQKSLQTQLSSAQEQLTARNAELQEESRERVDLMERLQKADSQKQQHLTEVFQLNKQIEELQASNRSYNNSVEELNEQIATLQTQIEEGGGTANTFVDNSTTATTTVDTTEANQLLDSRLTEFETILGRLSTENAQLKQDLDALKSGSVNQTAENTTPVVAEEPVLQVQTDKTVLYEKIIVSDREQDDLTKIEGVGDFLAAKLHAAGVFSFEEIAAWTPERINQITEEIGYLPGRIEKDKWVAQAAALIQGDVSTPKQVVTPVPTPTVAKTSSKKTKAKATSDLKIIEGIGPKIEEVLKAAGIEDWAGLAATEPGRLKEILEEAGGRFRMHNPYTWPLQARLAAAGRWEEFEQYQEELKGGKE